ncbi:MAG: energy transducer TonB [Spirochaetales bacterium]|nr:energy transducer TonB [Spirochaetales bacterium]
MSRIILSAAINSLLLIGLFHAHLFQSHAAAIEGEKEITLNLTCFTEPQAVTETAPLQPEPSVPSNQPMEDPACPVSSAIKELAAKRTDPEEMAEQREPPPENSKEKNEREEIESACSNGQPEKQETTENLPVNSGERDYKMMILAAIGENKIYPSAARERNQTGTARLQLVINAKGKLEECSLLETSGYQLLDKGAIKSVQRAAPFPKPPEGNGPTVIQFYMDYELN